MTLTRPVFYKDGATQLDGVLAWPESADGPLPGVLLIHGGAGLDDHARAQASRYAELGYTVLAADMFGPGIAGNRERGVTTLTELRDNPGLAVRTSLRARPDAVKSRVLVCHGSADPSRPIRGRDRVRR